MQKNITTYWLTFPPCQLSKAVQWLEKADFEAKIVIAGNSTTLRFSRLAAHTYPGNHDITLDNAFYLKHGESFHNKKLEDPAKCRALFDSSPTITYLQHGSAAIRLAHDDGPGTEFTVFGSPYCPEYRTWAFMYPRRGQSYPETSTATSRSATQLWAAIPSDIDILVTHTPPRAHCDDNHGCDALQETLSRVRPRLHVCGHVHQGRGAERVRWDTDGLSSTEEAATEISVEKWVDPNPDPASAKMSLVDLTARGGKRPLDFHDSAPTSAAGSGCGAPDLPDPIQRVSESQDRVGSDGPVEGLGAPGSTGSGHAPKSGDTTKSTGQLGTMDRAGRRETCVVNCAIVANGWPHVGGKRFHKPIVVDIDLPAWR